MMTASHAVEPNASASRAVSPPPPQLSIIICCHNSRERLAPTLRHIADQVGMRPEQWEVLLVDNGSTDDTVACARALWRDYGAPTQLRIVSEPKLGLANAQKTGIFAANYAIATFVDDDNWICPTWCATVCELMAQHPDAAAIASYSEAAFEEGFKPPAWFSALQHGYAVGAQADESGWVRSKLPRFHAAGLSFRRDVVCALFEGGFSRFLTGRSGKQLSAGEDAELTIALAMRGYRFWYDDRLRFAHYMPSNRLTVDYARNLFRGLGSASVIEDYYRAFAGEGGTPDIMFALRQVTVLRYANVMSKILRYELRARLAAPGSASRDQAQIEAAYFKGRLAGMRAYGGKRREILAHISHWARSQPIDSAQGAS